MLLFVDVGKERDQRIEIVQRVRVVLVVVALGAADRCTHPDVRQIPNPVGRVNRQVFLRLDAPLVGRLQQPVVAGRNELRDCRIRQQIAGQLLACELVHRHVIVECVDHVVTIGRDAVVLVAVIPDRVRVTHQIQPVDRHPFPERRRGKQPIDVPAIRAGTRVAEESIDLLRARRQSGQVETDAAQQGARLRIGGWLQMVFALLGENEVIHWIERPVGVERGWKVTPGRNVSPIGLVRRSLIDPGL